MEIDDLMLADIVSQFSILYNKTHKDFKDKNKKENAWKTIAETLGVDVTVAQNRWNVLRTRYGVEKKKEKNIPSGSAPKKPWHLLSAMSFLDKHIFQRKTIGNMKSPKSPKDSPLADCSPWSSFNSIISMEQPESSDEPSSVGLFDETEEDTQTTENYPECLEDNDASNKENSEDTNANHFSNQMKKRISDEKNSTPLLKKRRKKSEEAELMLKLSSTVDNFNSYIEKKTNVDHAQDHETQSVLEFAKSMGNDLMQIKNKRIRYRTEIQIMEIVKSALCDDMDEKN